MVKNEESGKHIMIVSLKLFHYLISIGLFAVFWLLWRYGSLSVFTGVGYRYNYFIIIFYGMLLLFFNRTYNAYLLGYSRIRECVIGQFLSQLFSVGIIYFMVSIAWNHWKNPFLFIVMLIVQGFFDCLWSYLKMAEPKHHQIGNISTTQSSNEHHCGRCQAPLKSFGNISFEYIDDCF